MSSVCFFELKPDEERFLFQRMDRSGCLSIPGVFSPEAIPHPEECEVLSTFINSRLNSDALRALPNLRLIATRSTGYDHVDLAYCQSKSIAVSNVPVYGDNTVAEHTFALILAISRKVIQAHSRTRTGDFSLDRLQGFDLRGRTLGVVGTGSIGTHVIRIARGFMMRVIAFDAHPDRRLADALDFEYVPSLDALLESSDIVTLHIPLLESTHHLINSGNIRRMKKGALLINTARGPVVDTSALLEALQTGHLAGAGLDVFEGEVLIQQEEQLLSRNYDVEDLKTLVKNHVLLRLENVIVTPHVAFNSIEAVQRILQTTADNIAAYRRGQPQNLIHRA